MEPASSRPRPTSHRRASRVDTDLRQIYHPRGMGQRRARRFRQTFFAAAALVCVALFGCDREPGSSVAGAPTSTPAMSCPSIASLVPAATDLIIAMGSGDQLVAISNFDQDRPETHGLPKVGDYLTNDWERLAQ